MYLRPPHSVKISKSDLYLGEINGVYDTSTMFEPLTPELCAPLGFIAAWASVVPADRPHRIGMHRLAPYPGQ